MRFASYHNVLPTAFLNEANLSSGFQDTKVPTRYFTSNKNLKAQIIVT